MKKTTLITVLTLFSLLSNAQNFAWAKRIGGTGSDYGYSITTDATGNVYTTGYFYDTVDFDPGVGVFNLSSVGNFDIFVSKLDVSGNFVWAKSIGGTGYDYGMSITTDASGNVYISGIFEGIVDFDPGAGVFNLSSTGSQDIFISKLDASGNFVWAKNIGGTGTDQSYSITTDASGNVYTTGVFTGTVDFNPDTGVFNLSSAGGDDIFISKLDVSGNFVWAKSMGGTNEDRGYSITTDVSGNVYSTGYFYDTADFDPGVGVFNLSSIGDRDIFISKLDASGNFVWAKSIGGTNLDRGNSITTDTSGNVYATGYFQSTADFDPGVGMFNLSSAGGQDIFISKLDASGNFVWAKSMGGTNVDYGNSITTDASGNIYTTGTFWGTADFDPNVGIFNLSSAGGQDIFISKLDASGNFVWAKKIGSASSDIGQSITIDTSENIYTTGRFANIADFDPGAGVFNLSSAGGNDIFILKLTCNTYSTQTITACDSYTWIDNVTYTTSNNTATHILTGGNSIGCDSIVTLDLTINTIDNTVTNSAPTLTANQSGSTYQWLDCDNNFSIISGETAQNYLATTTGNYAVEITIGNCVDTSNCENVIINSIKEITNIDFSVHPNPTKGLFTISLDDTQNEVLSYSILNLKGNTVKQASNIIAKQIIIDISNESKGIYFIKLNTSSTSTIYKLIKQ
ncbi:MAG TPA: SBBP repeat-containing protein [Vicingaceae bacterium]